MALLLWKQDREGNPSSISGTWSLPTLETLISSLALDKKNRDMYLLRFSLRQRDMEELLSSVVGRKVGRGSGFRGKRDLEIEKRNRKNKM